MSHQDDTEVFKAWYISKPAWQISGADRSRGQTPVNYYKQWSVTYFVCIAHSPYEKLEICCCMRPSSHKWASQSGFTEVCCHPTQCIITVCDDIYTWQLKVEGRQQSPTRWKSVQLSFYCRPTEPCLFKLRAKAGAYALRNIHNVAPITMKSHQS